MAAPVFRKFTKRVFVIVNIVVSSLFLLASCNAFLPPQDYWFLSIIGVGFPFLLVLVIAFLLIWVLFRSRWAFLPLACLLLGYPNIRALIAFNYGKEPSLQKSPSSLRILTWNVSWFDEQTRADKHKFNYRKDMLSFIRKSNPDVICFQEYVEPNTKRRDYNNRQDLTKLGYPYSMVVIDYRGWKNTWETGIAIFSKFPIIDSFQTRYPGPRNFRAGQSLMAIDINLHGQKVRIFNTHLQSFLFKKKDYHDLEIIRSASDSLLEASKSVIRKMAQAYRFRGQQAEVVKKTLSKSNLPTIICGDFNDIPNSYTYFQIRSGRQDAFVEAGKGIGRTFFNLSPTLRIDYIMPDHAFEVKQYMSYDFPYSEHYPVLADVVLKDTAN
jgi:endonuclease/exonuclease/phosphatase family metal-dependent hydrolase